MRMVYSKRLIEHFEHPRQVGRFDEAATDVGTGMTGTQETGGVLRVQIQVGPNHLITDTRFKAYGSPALIAAGSWLAEAVKGTELEYAGSLAHQPIAEALELTSAQLHCALLAEDAIRMAVRNYKDKQGVYV